MNHVISSEPATSPCVVHTVVSAPARSIAGPVYESPGIFDFCDKKCHCQTPVYPREIKIITRGLFYEKSMHLGYKF